MPYEEPDETDPMELVGVELPGDEASWRDMAECFAVEYARMGFTTERIRHLFDTPLYAGPFRAKEILGEQAVRQIIAEAVFLYGMPKTEVQDAPVVCSEEAATSYPPPGPCEQRNPQD